MPIDPRAVIEVTGFSWVPPFARGLVRDYRVRWALEEIGLDYRTRLIDPRGPRPVDYLLEQPFGQVPCLVEGDVRMFESGAICLYLAERSDLLLPRDEAARTRVMSWCFAAMNSVEPLLMQLVEVDIFCKGEPWTEARRPGLVEAIRHRLDQLAAMLGDKEWLEGPFTVGDLLMTAVLRNLRHTDLVTGHGVLGPYVARAEARPAFQRAFAAQLADLNLKEDERIET